MKKKTELRLVDLDQIKPWSKNPRLNNEAVPAVEKSIRAHGYLDFIETDEKLNILAGHTRLKALVSISQNGGIAGIKNVIDGKIPVLVHFGLKHKDAYRLANNKTGEFAEWDLPALKDILEGLDTGEIDMDITGFSSEDIEELMTQFHVPAEGLTDEDEIPEAEEAITKTGDLWSLGNHRLLCGDSTKQADVERLMEGQKANLCITSPPYWVGKKYESQKSEGEIDQFIKGVCVNIAQTTSCDCGRVVINSGTARTTAFDAKRPAETLLLADKYVKQLRPHDWLLRHIRIWVKTGGLPATIAPKTDVIDQHCEFLMTFYCPTGKHRGQNRVDAAWAQTGYFDDFHGEASAGGRHEAAYPVELPSRFIRLYSLTNEGVCDPFLGSGTTLIACEKLGRRCYGMEIEPHYCDVAVKRWENYIGKKAVLADVT